MPSLIKNESILEQKKFSSSLVFWFLKDELTVTNRRFLGEWKNFALGIIPTGTNNITFTLDNISSVKTSTDFSFGSFFVGLILLMFGLSFDEFGFFMLVLLLLGLNAILGAFKTALQITNNAGQNVKIPIMIFQRSETQQFTDKINTVLAERAEQEA